MSKDSFSKFRKRCYRYLPNYAMFLPCAIALILFAYIPMGGVVLAFKDFYPKLGIYGSPIISPFYKHFLTLFNDSYFWVVLKNTVVLSLLRLVIGFPVPIIVALLFNELRSKKFAKFVQTIMFLPYFISWIVLSGIIKMMFGKDGFVEILLSALHIPAVSFLTSGVPFLVIIIVVDIWKNVGYGMIIYLATMSAIDKGLYEAVEIDGGNRLHKMIHITLPGISSAIVIQLILSVSGILNGGFDQIYNLYSVPVYHVADILDTYLYRVGMNEGKVEMGTALGLAKSVVGFLLILGANKLTKLFGSDGIW